MSRQKGLIANAMVLSYRREKNLTRVVRGLRRQSFVGRIIIFHNAPSRRRVRGAINIVTDRNFGCIVRHAIGLLSDTERVLFCDDDLELLTDLSRRFRKAARSEPNAIIGISGCDVDPAAPPEQLYLSGGDYQLSRFQRYVDIVKGRLHLCRREHLLDALQCSIATGAGASEHRNNDDIILNLSVQLRTGIPGILIPLRSSDIRELPDPAAVCSRNDHWQLRSKLVNWFLRHGWRPRAHRGRFRRANSEHGSTAFKNELLLRRFFTQLHRGQLGRALLLHAQLPAKLVPHLAAYTLAGRCREAGKTQQAQRLYRALVARRTAPQELRARACYHLGMLCRDKSTRAASYFRKCLGLMPGHRKAAQELRRGGTP